MKLVQYRENCIGCNACVENAPSFWNISKVDGKANLIGSKEKNGIFILEINKLDLECNELACASCPVGIIKIENKN